KSFFGSGRLAPAENASLTRSLTMIPRHTIPSCAQTAEPSGLLGRFHFTSSAISGSASWTILRSFASIAPRQSGVFAINSSTGPARAMSAPDSFVYRVSAVPAAHGADVIASRPAATLTRHEFRHSTVADDYPSNTDEAVNCPGQTHIRPVAHTGGARSPRFESYPATATWRSPLD